MTIDIVELILIAVLMGLLAYYIRRQGEQTELISRLALRIAQVNSDIDRVDKATGQEIFLLRKEFEAFKDDYGDAAIDEMRQSAKREKAWADGINNIMSFGARYQDRGDST